MNYEEQSALLLPLTRELTDLEALSDEGMPPDFVQWRKQRKRDLISRLHELDISGFTEKLYEKAGGKAVIEKAMRDYEEGLGGCVATIIFFYESNKDDPDIDARTTRMMEEFPDIFRKVYSEKVFPLIQRVYAQEIGRPVPEVFWDPLASSPSVGDALRPE
jgi:hypothetical protein